MLGGATLLCLADRLQSLSLQLRQLFLVLVTLSAAADVCGDGRRQRSEQSWWLEGRKRARRTQWDCDDEESTRTNL